MCAFHENPKPYTSHSTKVKEFELNCFAKYNTTNLDFFKF